MSVAERTGLPRMRHGSTVARSLNDIRDSRALSDHAQALRDRAAAIQRLRQSQFLGIRG